MTAEKDEITGGRADIGDAYKDASIAGMMYEAALDTQRALGRLEADVRQLRDSNERIDNRTEEQGRKLGDLETTLARIGRRQLLIGSAVTATIGAFLLLSNHWPALRSLGDLLFGQSAS